MRATPTYTKRIKFNLVVCDVSGTPTGLPFASGRYIKADQFYSELAKSDTNNFWYDVSGNANIIAFDTMPNIYHNKIFVSLDKQKILTFENALAEGSECYVKAIKETRLVEIEQLQDVHGNMVFDSTPDPIFTLKSGVITE